MSIDAPSPWRAVPTCWRAPLALFFSLSLFACDDPSGPGRDDVERQEEVDQGISTSDSDVSASADAALPDQATAADMLSSAECEQNIECPLGEGCIDGACVPVECRASNECSRIQACWMGECRDRCFGDNTCFRGGVCFRGVCIPEECEEDSDCPEGELCRGELCVEPTPCEEDSACEEGEICREGNCELLPRCGGDANCEEGEICVSGRCEVRPTCETGGAPCEEGTVCIGGLCVPDLCRGPEDCAEGERCSAGECELIPTIEVLRVLILNRPQSLLFGQSLQLRAVALDEVGDVVAAEGFVWSTSQAERGEVDQDGLFIAGESAGEVEIQASWTRGGLGVEPVQSEPLSLRILAPPPPVERGYQLRITDQRDGREIANASVHAGGEVLSTDEEGRCPLPDLEVGEAITVMAAGYDTLTVVGVPSGNLHLPPKAQSDDSAFAGL
ncbi:MAG: carboxypeptidase-like regulatory domain-containing protein, partial [Myxococcota bacterium]|nr:carboxypeptidase-like regulatory domain-containing protein [Myxococcota bacterium]